VGLVVDVRHSYRWNFFPSDRDHRPLWTGFFLGISRIHHDDSHTARRPSRFVLEFGGLHSFAVLAHRHVAMGAQVPERRADRFLYVLQSLFIPARIAMAGDHKRFLERSAQIQSGLLVCVYCLSHAPALLDLELHRFDGSLWTGSNSGLLFFFVVISQVSDVLHWVWSRIKGRRIIAKDVSSSRTWEGLIGGALTTGIVGALLYWVTPFQPWEAAGMSVVVAFLGFAGSMTMSAIKRDRGVHDYGSLVVGHAGVLDRIDTICFSAPIFYHLTRFFFVA
jgi:predicted CDP-diglyceride synthetase/phosphatidate cytidylyltransferase